jgi:hypothetical protein
MRCHVVRMVMLAVAAAVPLLKARGQEAAPASAQTTRPGPWALSLGINSTELNLGTQRPGTRAELMGSIARHWTLAPHLGLRTQAVFGGQFPRALTLNDANGCAGCELWTSRQFGGLNAAFTYQWREGKAFSPYLLTGAEALVMHSRSRFDAPCAATNSCAFVDPYLVSQSANEATLGLTAGAGIAFKVRKTNWFVEYATHAVPDRRRAITPLSIGLRF